MKMLISCLLKYIVFIKYFESDFLEKLSILIETLQIKMMPLEEGTQSTMLIEIGHVHRSYF